MTRSTCHLTDAGPASPLLERLTDEQRQRLTELLDRHLSAMEQGAPLDEQALMAEHPDLADALRVYFRSLQDLHDMAAGFAAASLEAAAPPAGDGRPARRIGDFELIREIGRGGMGVVYEARQISLDRRVAVKLLPFAAVLDAKQIARFKSEAQAAAEVQHPNIVPVFALGVERGVHYYAMRYVDGQPLDRALAELRAARALRSERPARGTRRLALETLAGDADSDASPEEARPSTAEIPAEAAPAASPGNWPSLKLAEYFRTVARLGVQAAEALHAAHEQGVIHRDVKPSNLLLDSQGKLWVTDFGLARCRRDATLTRTGDVVGTMRYMSPEQAAGRGALVDERSDVYSLGVTLYEMLCLELPFAEGSGGAWSPRSAREEPLRPRLRQPEIPADLETVVLKAMADAREDRYATAQELADDLRRVLEGKPTVARPASAADRLMKWVRRHRRVVRIGMGAILLAVVGLATAVVLIARERDRAEANSSRSERYFRDAREVLDRFGLQLSEKLAEVPGAEDVRRELLEESLAYYQRFIDDVKDAPELRADMALAYGKIAALTGQVGSADEAIAAQKEACRLFQALAAADPARGDYRLHWALCENNLALALHRSGDTEQAEEHFAQAVRVQQQLTAADPRNQAATADLALSFSNLGLLQSDTGNTAHARTAFRSAIELLEPCVAAAPNNPQPRRQLAAAYNNLAGTYLGAEPAQAAALHEQALAQNLAAAEARPASLGYRRELALTLNNLGAAYLRSGRPDKALVRHREAIGIQEELAQLAPAQVAYRADLAVSENNLGLVRCRSGQLDEAELAFRRSLAIYQDLLAKQPEDGALESGLGGAYNNLGEVFGQREQWPQAVDAFRQAAEHQRRALDRAPQVARYRLFLSKHYSNCARALQRCGRFDEALQATLARRDLWVDDGRQLFVVAEDLASAHASEGSAGVSVGRDACAQLVVETLRQAVAAGYALPSGWDRKPPFAALGGRGEFNAFVSQQ